MTTELLTDELREELIRAIDERASARELNQNLSIEAAQLEVAVENLQAENVRLRAALEHMVLDEYFDDNCEQCVSAHAELDRDS